MKRTCRYCKYCLHPVSNFDSILYHRLWRSNQVYCSTHGAMSREHYTLNSNEAHKQMRAKGIAKGFAYATQKH